MTTSRLGGPDVAPKLAPLPSPLGARTASALTVDWTATAERRGTTPPSEAPMRWLLHTLMHKLLGPMTMTDDTYALIMRAIEEDAQRLAAQGS